MRTEPIRPSPNDELARRLNQHDLGPVDVEANGVRYSVARQSGDIWASYDPERALRAVEKSAGILKANGVNVERLLRDVREDRSQDSSGRPAE